MRELTRTRWAAIGAAVAVTIGAGGVSLTHAAISTGEKPVYVSLSQPCRVADTRPASTVGPKSDPIQAGEVNAYEIQITGGSGECTGGLAIPSDAVGISLNVTAIAPSAPTTGRSFFTVYPGDAALPGTSNLNFLNGQAPVANKVDVGLSATGTIKVANNEGTAHAAVDIFGYYVDHKHSVSDITNEAGVVYNADSSVVNTTSTPTAAITASMRAPSDGFVNIEVSGHWNPTTAGATAWCQLQKGTAAAIDTSEPWILLDDPGNITGWRHFSAHRTMPIAVADNPTLFIGGQALSLVCDEIGGSVSLDDLHITATFFPTSYAPFILTI